MTSITDSTRETANMQQTIVLLEARLQEQESATRHWLNVVRKQLRVVDAARRAVRWWLTVCDRFPSLAAPWVGQLAIALADLDDDKALAKTLRERLGETPPTDTTSTCLKIAPQRGTDASAAETAPARPSPEPDATGAVSEGAR